ncbi:polysaccharide deacetylase family protein [Streptomyces sp. SCSIO 30461]|uniref:polysaccharide deacetylase family protein n=1 Tax=Streptomyces sp. SCSIO 30461 TaxID=3118085 RepID=UPI0030CB71C7
MTKGWRRGALVLTALVVAAIGGNCAVSGSCTSGNTSGPGSHTLYGAPGAAGAPGAPGGRMGKPASGAQAAAARYWGLDEPPLVPPPPPDEKPELTTREGFEVRDHDGLPPVFTTVPTDDRVVFLTIDDGAEKDPALLRMMSDLGIPYSAFLTDYLARGDYSYFGRMQERGVVLNNHTLTHAYLRGRPYQAQRREICGQQDRMEEEFGERPRLFRPPYGAYDRNTLRAAESCGIEAVPLWAAEAFADRMEWREADRELRPGDIILTHFRGEAEWRTRMPELIRRVMNLITERGYAVARLEDYV